MLKNLLAIGIAYFCVELVLADSFSEECLAAHNKYRRLHNASDLVLDDKLNEKAKEWAEHISQSGRLQHRPNAGLGENMYATFDSKEISGDEPVEFWYSQGPLYDFSNPGYNARAGHFTQVVWKGSKRLGCAMAKRHRSYVVAYYDPAGNMLREYAENVLPENVED